MVKSILTSSIIKPDDHCLLQAKMRSGKKIQLALYLMAAKRLEMIDADAEPFHLGYWKVQETGFVTPLNTRTKMKSPLSGEDLELLETTLEGLVPHLAQLIRDGIYPVQVDQDVAHLDPAFSFDLPFLSSRKLSRLIG